MAVITSADLGAAVRLIIQIAAVSSSFVLTLLILVPFSPMLPSLSLDSSWPDALNEAIAQHKVFGKDIVFTYGPLASVGTHLYHPATDGSMLGLGILFAAAFFAGCAYLSPSYYLILAVPLVLSQALIPDTYFICLPFIFLILAMRWSVGEVDTTLFTSGVTALVTAAVALSPLVKVSFSVPVLACGGLALILIARRSITAAALLAMWAVIVVAIAWCVMGQPLGGIYRYFASQKSVISGYSEAMSLTGPVSEILVYLSASLVMCLALVVGGYRRFGKLTIAVALGLLVVLFMAFKEGFVRHDAHALAAGSTLLVLSFVLLLTFRSRLFAAVMIVGICSWATINGRYIATDPVSSVSLFSAIVSGSWEGLRTRISDPTYFPRRFDNARAEIRSKLPLPATDGTVDLYPYDLAAIFAAGQRWSPRPVIQSYTAYTPSLAALNRDHLQGRFAPDRVYFSIAPIDGRYPSFDDGASWPDLIARYRVIGYFDQYAILEKRAQPIAIDFAPPLLDQKRLLGEEVIIPTTTAPLWAKIDVRPTLIGRFVSIVYKLPALQLVMKCTDGTTDNFRFVPGEAASGFLLSPTVRSAVDFIALQSPEQREFFTGCNKPLSLLIKGESHFLRKSEYLWNSEYSITLAPLNFQPDARVPALLAQKPVAIPQSVVKGGDCYIDMVNQTAAQNSLVKIGSGFFSVSGWGVVSGSEGKPNDEVFVALRSRDGVAMMVKADKTRRDDVTAFFKHTDMGDAGFQAFIDASAIHNLDAVSVVQKVGNTYLECTPGRVTVETSR